MILLHEEMKGRGDDEDESDKDEAPHEPGVGGNDGQVVGNWL